MTAMQISTEMFPHDIGRALNWIGSQVGGRVEKRVKEFKNEGRRNPFIERYYRNTYSLEFTLAYAWRQYRTTGIFPEGGEYSLTYAFAGMTQRIYEKLSVPGQKRLLGCLRDGAKGEYGFRPLAYEMTMASHLSREGYDIECVDLENKGRFDFLAKKHDIQFEMECKTTSSDKGRKIHRKELHLLSYELLPITTKLVNSGGGHALRLIIPDRLERNKKQLGNLKDIAISAVRDGTAESDVGQAEYKAINVVHWPEPDHGLEIAARELLAKLFRDAGNRHVIAQLSPSRGFAAIGVESKKSDTVVDELANDAKAAADQCTGGRPALVMIQLMEITPDELAMLSQTRSGIQYVAHAVFKDDKRTHIDSVIFSLPPVISPLGIGGNVLSGVVRVIHNPSPKMPSDAARGLFGLPVS